MQFAATDLASRAEDLLAPVVAEAGYELLLCEWSGSATRGVLWVYIERTDGEPVNIGDCVLVNNAVTDLLDVEDLVPGPYDLRVSSPGVERPLRRPEHFARHVGDVVKVKTWEPIGQRRNWKGALQGVEGDVISVLVDGQEHRIPTPAIEKAHLVWAGEAKGQKKGGSRRKKRSQR